MRYLLEVRDANTRNLLFALAEQQQLEVCREYRRSPDGWPVFAYREDTKDVVGMLQGEHSACTWVKSVGEMVDLLLEVGSSTEVIPLTSTYKAIVNRRTKIVSVGCQDIPFEMVEEVYVAMHRQKKVL